MAQVQNYECGGMAVWDGTLLSLGSKHIISYTKIWIQRSLKAHQPIQIKQGLFSSMYFNWNYGNRYNINCGPSVIELSGKSDIVRIYKHIRVLTCSVATKNSVKIIVHLTQISLKINDYKIEHSKAWNATIQPVITDVWNSTNI